MLKYLSCRSLTARDCAVNRAVVAGHICRFAREEEFVIDRGSERLLRAVASDFSVAISAARKRIRLPIVTVSIHQQTVQRTGVDRQ